MTQKPDSTHGVSVPRQPLLLIDDDPRIGLLLRAVFDSRRFVLHVAEDGRTGLERLEEAQPLLVILDLQLPDIDGLEVLSAISQRNPRLPVLMLTGMADLRTAVTAMQLGAFNYLTKPVDNAELLLTVERALERASLLSEVEELRERLGALEPVVLQRPRTGTDVSLREIARAASQAAERQAILSALRESGGNRGAASRRLRTSSRTLEQRIRRYGIELPGAGR